MKAWIFLIVLALAVAGCGRKADDRVQGYVEGEFVYIASPFAGALETLSVERGAQVKVGDQLFALERGAETAVRAQAAKRLEEGMAQLEDSKKGKRPPEIEANESLLSQSRTSLALSEREFARQAALSGSGASSPQEMDKARSVRDQDLQRVSQMEADLKTARLGLRSDQIAAAEANVRALEAAVAKADWDLAQKRQSAPQAGSVFDTLYRAGEWVPAGRPVISLLTPAGIKVRAFVPQTRLGAIQVGNPVRVSVDGVSEPFSGKISFISPQAEYTPPVIYSQESRTKLVFMVEVTFDPATAAKLHPGQPVDVQF